MNKYLKQLVELSRIDKRIDSFEPEIENIKRELNQEVEKETQLTVSIETLSEALKENELKRKKNEAHLAELSEKLKSLSEKSGAVKNEREAKALQLEEEISKEQIDFANEEIERLDKVKELKESEKAELEEALANKTDEIAEIRGNIEKDLENIEKERMTVYEDKQKLVSEMNQNMLIFYEKIRRWAKNTTVVPVRKQACYGCYMRINDQIYANVIKGEDITTCPHCGRILYKEKEEEAVETAS